MAKIRDLNDEELEAYSKDLEAKVEEKQKEIDLYRKHIQACAMEWLLRDVEKRQNENADKPGKSAKS